MLKQTLVTLLHSNGVPVKVVKVTGGSGYADGTYYAPIRGDGTGGVVKIVVTGGEIVHLI